MLDLALHFGRGPILLKDVAGRQEISEKYLGHLTHALKSAGLLNSSRGAHGGYALSRAPEEITLREVVAAVEGNLAIAECVTAPDVCPRVDLCVTREVWARMTEEIRGLLESITLRDMVTRQEEKRKEQGLMYSI